MNTAYMYFELNGIKYRTNGSKVEGLDGSTWNVSNSLRVVLAARDAFNAKKALCESMNGNVRCQLTAGHTGGHESVTVNECAVRWTDWHQPSLMR